MKRFVTFACRGLAIYFGTLALTLFLADTLRGKRAWARDPVGTASGTTSTLPRGTQGCPPCTEGWVFSKDLWGIECEHGPEHSFDCRQIQMALGTFDPEQHCWEINGNKAVTVTINGVQVSLLCKCFECKQSNVCESTYMTWRAWCGYAGDLPTESPCSASQYAHLWVPVYMRRSVTSDGMPCGWNQGHDPKKHCGNDQHDHVGCTGTNLCQSDPTEPYRVDRLVRVWRCAPGQPQIPSPPQPTASTAHP